MRNTGNITKQNLSMRKNKAEFVDINSPQTHSFIYLLRHKFVIYWDKTFEYTKVHLNRLYQKMNLELAKYDLKQVLTSFMVWFVDVVTEGFLLNYITYNLLEFQMTIHTIIAYGLIITQSHSIYWRFKNGKI